MRKGFNLFWILLFLIGVILPVIYINKSDVSNQENRTLAKFPEIKKEGKLNKTFEKEFESWLGDRFGGRDYLISFGEGLKYVLNEYYQKGGVVKGKAGWLFLKRQKNSTNLSEESISSLKKLKRFCDENNIQLFVILPSRSVDIYPEYYPLEYDNSLTETTTDFLKETDISVIISEENLKKGKGEKVFFKKDHHWTDAGALIAYKDFVHEIKKVYPSFPEYNSEDFEVLSVPQEEYKRDGVSINSFCKKLGINNFIFCPSEQYPYYRYKGEIKKTIIKDIQKWAHNKYFNNKGFPLKTILISRSLGGTFKIFLTSYIQNVITIDTNGYGFPNDARPSIKPYLQFIKEEKPDVLIMLQNPDNLREFFL